MRPLTEEETQKLFEKLSLFIGTNIKFLIDRTDEAHVFRLHRDRVYYVSEQLMRRATNIAREALVSFGTCFGKFTKSGQFRLHITCLEYLAEFAKYKMWLKPSAEMQFLYGNHVLKSGLARVTENAPRYTGVVVYNMQDVPIGFGTAALSTDQCHTADPTAYVLFHMCDVGEYLREETEGWGGGLL